jgi:hypothetical protein
VSGRRWDPSTFTRTERPDGSTELNATVPVCDFCLSPDVVWEFPCAPLQLVGHPLFQWSDDEWAACDGCKELVEAGRIGPLMERMLKGQQATENARYPMKPIPIWRRETRENVRRFMDSRLGPARPYQP